MNFFTDSKLKFIFIFSIWFSIAMTVLKLYGNYEGNFRILLNGNLAFTFLFWLLCGGFFGYFCWLKKCWLKKQNRKK